MADYKGCRVQLAFLQKELLPDTDGVRVKQSVCAYADVLRDKAVALFPNAEVVVYCVKGDSLPTGLHCLIEAGGKARNFQASEETLLAVAQADAAKADWKVMV